MEYYFFELTDYALPGFASGSSLYFGTKTDFRNLLRAAGKEENDLKATFKAFCNGNKTIKHYVAFAEKRFAYPAKLIKRRKISLPASVYKHINIWGFPYNVFSDSTELTLTLIKFKGKYYVYYRAKVNNPRLEINPQASRFDRRYMDLGDSCWGFPGMMKYSEKDGERILYNTLMVYDATFDKENEAVEYFSALKNVNMKYFYDEVFGDG